MRQLAFLVVLAVLPMFPAGAQAQAPVAPVAAYGFDEVGGSSVLDASGSGRNGTVAGATRSAAGRFGGALSFDGANDKVDVPHAAAFNLGSGMTLEAWVRPSSLSGWRTAILKERPGGLSYALYASDGSRPTGFVNTGSGDRDATGSAGLPVNAWSHLAATYDGGTLRLYVDGAQVATRAVSAGIASSTGALRIGGNAVWGEWFSGLIDEVRIYNRALTAAQIQTDMNTPVGQAEPPPPPPDRDQVGQWTGPVELGLVAVNMIQLHTGKILMFRGETAGGTSATVWNPVTGARTPVPAPYNIFCSGHAQLADGRILVVGGHDHENGVLGSAQAAIFDPVGETWTSVPSMSQRRWYPSATTLPDGRVLVTSGAKTAFDDIADVPEVYDPKTNSWTRLESARLSFPYYPFSFVMPDGDVLIAGAGENPTPTRTLDVATQQWTTVDASPVDGGSAAMYQPGKVVKSGTSATTDVSNVPASRSTYVLDMAEATPRWRRTADMARPRAYHNLAPLPDGTVIATGGGVTTEGKDVSAAVYEAEIWSPATETWKTMASMRVPRLYHQTALLLPDARVVVAGSGDSYGGPDQTTAEFFEPPYLFKGARPTLSGAPSLVEHGSSFTANATGPVAKVALLRPGADTHQFDEDARHLNLPFTQSGGQLTIEAPANANLAPPGYYMLFALSPEGVPSVASFIRLPEPDADTTNPTVSVSSPSAGATVSGTVGLDAAAADNVAVTSVQFRVDGVNVGLADTTAPYQATWSTASVPNGSHVIDAVARDGSGNGATSAPVTVTVSNAAPPPPPPATGLVAAWGFDAGSGATVADRSGRGNTGTLSGPAWTAGRFGGALSFDGVNDRVNVSDSGSLDLTTGMTVEAWVRPTSIASWRTVLLKERTGGLSYALYCSNDGGVPAAWAYAGGAERDATATLGLPTGTWSHLATTYDGANLRLYLNGSQIASRSVIGSIAVSTRPLRIGGNAIWSEWFAGQIDEVRVYNRALSAAEIGADMNAPVG